ncbi:hypothetical protein GZH47_33465 (plasmid) [Paenibacillus rhizovicinus]|uniref:Uncharacterized protein n=1 Tax=Paenibacillus rhizovicinus TaxID=2704463 RepID=A0A6C0PCL2_9BACL|nr:hypothetical protein [Paenibacillus rhizovicinus]QHW35803.1 hypothetical protein GZH47_33465 [Paenibacillus rhizovicinus]
MDKEKKEIGNVINGLFGAFEAESDAKNADWIRSVTQEYHYLDLNNPEKFSLLLTMAVRDKADALMRHALPSIVPADLNRKLKHKVEFAFLHYDFIARHLKSIILKFEGHGCSTDKTRWLIDSYVKYIISGDLPLIEEKKYWHPACGEVADWMAWIDTMGDLYYGNVERYALAKIKVFNSYAYKWTESGGDSNE